MSDLVKALLSAPISDKLSVSDAKVLAGVINTLGYTRSGLTEAQREAESAAIIKGFLDCPEIADCAPEDKDGDTHSLESRARRFLRGDAVPKPARRVVQIAIAQGWTIPAEKLSFVPEVIQLCDDGSVWTCALDSMKQRRLPPISGGGV